MQQWKFLTIKNPLLRYNNDIFFKIRFPVFLRGIGGGNFTDTSEDSVRRKIRRVSIFPKCRLTQKNTLFLFFMSQCIYAPRWRFYTQKMLRFSKGEKNPVIYNKIKFRKISQKSFCVPTFMVFGQTVHEKSNGRHVSSFLLLL